MAFADSSGTRLAFVAESTDGTTPASPSFQNLRFTGESLNYNKETVSSEEIRADRNVSDSIDVGYAVAGDIEGELSYGTLDPLLEGLFQSTWSSNVLKNGTTKKFFTFEKTFEQGATDSYMRFTGCQIGAMTLNINARERVTYTMSVMGRGHTSSAAALSGATYTAANTNAISAASNDVSALTLTGISPAPTVMSLTVNIENNLREQTAVGTQGLVGIGSGRCVVTGSISIYFENLAAYDAFVNHTDVGISWTVGSVTNEKYTINIPKAKFTTGTVPTPGNDQDIMLDFEWQGLYSTASSPPNNATIILTRAVA
ncbi:phage tail tube protein [Rhodobium gokarnense]|uniref:Tail protein n=1 Tax=Rhodobium gokarnense TaxID=364296 RepID=A0ABT3HH48_9HYPH|nr:phage tail tube protein [Rhodobium gokarnense]MCW2309735.1 hypothetical protein [Rhodobium gokarnense]